MIIMAMVVAFFLASISSSQIFITGTPRINPLFIAKLQNLPSAFTEKTTKFIALLRVTPTPMNVATNNSSAISAQDQKMIQNLDKLPVASLNLIATGIYAKEDKNSSTIYVRVTKDAQWEEKVIEIDGKKITLQFPKQ